MIVVTLEVNEYDQRGGYFVGLFNTYEEALKEFKRFGRHTPSDDYGKWDEEWYVYYEVEVGETFEPNEYGTIAPKKGE